MKHESLPSFSEFEIFPYLLIRYASGAHADFERLSYVELDNMLNSFNVLTLEFQRLKEMICDYLYHVVPKTPSIAEKQFLIGIKRDIYNGRDLDIDTWISFMEGLPKSIQLEFEGYLLVKKRLTYLKSEWQDQYNAHLLEHRLLLQKLSKNELLQKGIRLSSKVLFDQLAAFANTPIASFRPKELRQEYSLLRYMTRTYFKTSPFSTFTHLGLCNLSKELLLEIPSCNLINSHIRLNNEIFNYLTTLMSLNPEINEQLYVKFNPSIVTSGENVSFLVNFRNLESFQKIENTLVVQALLQIRDERKTSLKLNEILKKLGAMVDSTRDKIKTYLLKLFEIGFLEFDFQTSGISPNWDKTLIKYLKAITDPSTLLKETIEVLDKQSANCQLYGESTSDQRSAILETMLEQFNKLYNHFLEDLGLSEQNKETYKQQYKASFDVNTFKKHPYLLPEFTTEKLIYEDSFTKFPAYVNHESMNEIVTKVNDICDFLAPLDSNQVERNRMNAFFLTQFKRTESVSLLDFYYSYYSQVKKPLQDSQKGNKSVPDSHQKEFTLLYNQWVDQLSELIKPEIDPSAEEIVLNKYLIQRMVYGKEKNIRRVSRGMFLQCFKNESKLHAIVNNVFLGMGRASGRFLHLFDPLVAEKLKDFNNSLSENSLLMELSDGSYFNANSHPPLLPYELKIPNGHNSLPVSAQIPVRDILVYFDETEGKICLRHQNTGQRILPFDLCLQSLSQRSKLYQLLSYFCNDQSVNFSPIQHAIHKVIFDGSEQSGKREVYYFPRIVYEKQVILKRKSWSVLTSSVPKKGEQQTDADYFMILNQWRKKNDFPQHFFLYIRPRHTDNEADTSDDYKPQYIRFDTPLLVLLWCKLLKKAGEYIYFEEMMPNTEMLVKFPVNEILVQWYMN